VYDTGSERIGVVTALPEDLGAAVYQLISEDGGLKWTALRGRLAPHHSKPIGRSKP